MFDAKVADADRADLAFVLDPTAALPHRRSHLGPTVRVVNEVEVGRDAGFLRGDVDAMLDPVWVRLVVHELGREVDLRENVGIRRTSASNSRAMARRLRIKAAHLAARRSRPLHEVANGLSARFLILVPLSPVNVL